MPEITIPNGERYHPLRGERGTDGVQLYLPDPRRLDLGVERRRAGVVTRLVLDTDYAVSGAGIPQPGGTRHARRRSPSRRSHLAVWRRDRRADHHFVGETFTAIEVNAELDRIAQALLDLEAHRQPPLRRRRDGRRDRRPDPAAGGRSGPAKVFAFSSTGAPDVRLDGHRAVRARRRRAAVGGLGVTGDLALGTDGLVWSKASGSWVVTTINLRGATGPTGSIGTLPDGTPAAPHRLRCRHQYGLSPPGRRRWPRWWVGREKTTATGLEVLTNSAFLTLPEHATAAATPAAGKVAVYGKANGRVYAKDAGGPGDHARQR